MNTASLFSADWHRVRDLAPRLAPDVAVVRQVYRGRVVWMLTRPTSQRQYRLSQASYEIVAEFDGQISMHTLWQRVLDSRDEHAPTQDELLDLLGELHDAQLLLVDRRLDVGRLFERQQDERVSQRRQRYLNPLYLRFALGDPDAWLENVAPYASALFGRRALAFFCVLMTLAGLALLANADRFVQSLADIELLNARHALVLMLVWPALKLVHELAHALAVKCRGGEVHEVGLAMMVLLPLPYVDASASGAFRERRDRLLVAAAGMLAEAAVAAFAALVWVASGGTVADVALAVMILAGISTLLFNGNPLLKFDGYFLLSDWLEIPNLAERSQRYLAAWLRQRFTGAPLVHTAIGREPTDSAERRWLLGYGVAAGIYRTVLMLSIAWMLSERWLVLGLALAAWAIYGALCRPALRLGRAVMKDPDWSNARARTSISGLALVALLLFTLLPLPHATVAEGLVWLPDDALVRVDVDCEIVALQTPVGHDVVAGTPLFDCDDPTLDARIAESRASLDRLQVERAGLGLDNPVELARLDRALKEASKRLEDTIARRASRRVTARRDGRFDAIGTEALAGRYLAPGDVAGYVIDAVERSVRVALAEHAAAALVRGEDRASLRIPTSNAGSRIVDTQVIRRHPEATFTVVSAGLTRAGGGALETEPGGSERQVVEPVFEVELDWPPEAGEARIGSRVLVRFEHAPAPLARRLMDGVRRTLLARESVSASARGPV